MIQLRSYQEALKFEILSAWQHGFKNVLARSPTGSGKCLGKGTPVLMFDGTTRLVEEVKTGEYLMGPDSTPRQVLSTTKGVSKLYKIIPVKGDAWICNDSHILSIRHTETGEILDINIEEYISRSDNFKHLHKQYRTGVEFNYQVTNHDPYLLGLYLAEGSYSHTCITNPDTEILTWLEEWSIDNGMCIRKEQGKGCLSYHFSSSSRGWYDNELTNLRFSCTSKDDRWIPQQYLSNTRLIRLQVLAGLLDGDGHMSKSGFQIITKYPSLNRDILFLARSVGLAAYSKKVKKKIKATDFEGEYYSISISGDCSIIPTKVKRKQSPKRLQRKNVLNTGFEIEDIGEGEYYGFEITGDRRFVLGDFTVTHNTVLFSDLSVFLSSQSEPVCIAVHRKELVSQISLTLCSFGIYHNIIASKPTIRGIIAEQRKAFGKQWYSYKADVTVVSVDTLNSRIDQHRTWANSIKVWIIDEAAHVLKANKWGRLTEHFPNARGLGVTATPQRLDRAGLGSHAKGVFDIMVHGPEVSWLIKEGYLADYKLAFPKSDYEAHLRKAASDHDYTREAMAQAAAESQIVGDVVKEYIKICNGKQAIVFASDSMSASRMELAFLNAGIPAKLLMGDTPDAERLKAMDEYRAGYIKVLINIDLFDEGLDVPGIEAVFMARPTMSLGKYLQICGRVLRPVYAKGYDLSTKEGRIAAQKAGPKPFGIIVDHVGNFNRHKRPDMLREWTLDDIIKKREVVNLHRNCENWECNAPFERWLKACPFCHTEVTPTRAGGGGDRVGPKEVEGDLVLLDSETLRQMEGAARLEDPASMYTRVAGQAGHNAGQRALVNQQIRIAKQQELIQVIAQWSGIQRHRHHLSDREIHKKFYCLFDSTISGALAGVSVEMDSYMEEIKGMMWA